MSDRTEKALIDRFLTEVMPVMRRHGFQWVGQNGGPDHHGGLFQRGNTQRMLVCMMEGVDKPFFSVFVPASECGQFADWLEEIGRGNLWL